MLNKKKCKNCQEQIKNSYNFCPNCGIQLKEPSKDWGMLGKTDAKNTQIPPENNIFKAAMPGNLINKMLGSALKMLEKEMQKELGQNSMPKAKVKLMINGKEINPQNQTNQKNKAKVLPIEFTKQNLEKWVKLKKQEPKTNLKRIGDTIQYEIYVPGVSSIKDISILKLEQSLELKAIGNKYAYQKIIQINLPLKRITLLNEKITLELDASTQTQ